VLTALTDYVLAGVFSTQPRDCIQAAPKLRAYAFTISTQILLAFAGSNGLALKLWIKFREEMSRKLRFAPLHGAE